MISTRNLSPKAKNILIIIVVLLVAVGLYFLYNTDSGPKTVVEGQPTTFAEFGVLNFRAAEGSKNLSDMYLIYEEEGKPSLTTRLKLNEDSICVMGSSATQCLAISATLNIPFNNRRAVAEGIETDNNEVIIKKLLVLQADEPDPFVPHAGLTYIPWMQAKTLIQECKIKMVTQSHDLNVDIELQDGQNVIAVEPTIDEVFGVVSLSRENCGNIPVATE